MSTTEQGTSSLVPVRASAGGPSIPFGSPAFSSDFAHSTGAEHSQRFLDLVQEAIWPTHTRI